MVSRQCPDAGFCFYRAWGVEESNPADTCAAVACLRLLSEEVPRRPAVLRWLHATQHADGAFETPTIAWYALDALHQLDESPRVDPREYLHGQAECLALWSNADVRGSEALLLLARLVELCARHGAPLRPAERDVVEANVRSLRSGDGGYGTPHSNLVDTECAVAVLRLLGLPTGDTALRDFLRHCEDAQQGFRLVPGSSASSLAVTHAGLRLCVRLDAALATAAAASRFALSCQASNGGFGRTTGAIPTLDDTRLALEILIDPGIGVASL